jgi:L-threonylcarbamoyladenylate synthase
VESTIVDVTDTDPVILRVGGVSRARVETALHRAVTLRTSGETAAPGKLASHYATRRAQGVELPKEPLCSRSGRRR